MQVGHWRFAGASQPAVSHVLFAIDVDIFGRNATIPVYGLLLLSSVTPTTIDVTDWTVVSVNERNDLFTRNGRILSIAVHGTVADTHKSYVHKSGNREFVGLPQREMWYCRYQSPRLSSWRTFSSGYQHFDFPINVIIIVMVIIPRYITERTYTLCLQRSSGPRYVFVGSVVVFCPVFSVGFSCPLCRCTLSRARQHERDPETR